MTVLLDQTAPFDMDLAPLRIGTVTLAVRDLDRIIRFYRDALGLSVLDQTPRSAVLGAGTRPLLRLEGDPALAAHDPREAGLFHTAFLLPARSDLARWLVHARDHGLRLDGASDHGVSEAVYLSDPEGNGIEIYVDRVPADWPRAGGGIAMVTEPLDLRGLMATTGGRAWAGAPDGSRVGHVHLQVGDLAASDAFQMGELGFEVTCRYPGASFYGAGGYHHQLAGNVWNSAGAGRRREDRTGLREVELIRPGAATTGEVLRIDPWGTRFRLRAG